MTVTKSVRTGTESDAFADAQEMKVGKNSTPGSVAGAIKGVINEGKRVTLLAVGPDAVHGAVSAVSLARIWLQEESSIDLCFRPEFVELELEHGGEMLSKASAVRLYLLSAQL